MSSGASTFLWSVSIVPRDGGGYHSYFGGFAPPRIRGNVDYSVLGKKKAFTIASKGLKKACPNSKRAGGDSLMPVVALAIMMAKAVPLSAGS